MKNKNIKRNENFFMFTLFNRIRVKFSLYLWRKLLTKNYNRTMNEKNCRYIRSIPKGAINISSETLIGLLFMAKNLSLARENGVPAHT